MKTLLVAVLIAAPVAAYCEPGASAQLGVTAETLDGLVNGMETMAAPVASELRLRDVMKVMKKSFWESKSAFYKRAEGEIKSALSGIFPLADTCKVGLYDHLCGPDQASSYPGLGGYAEWQRGDWKYTVQLYACSRDPLYIKYVSIVPAYGDETKMPKTREEFVTLVSQLSYVEIADAQEATDYRGRKIITKALSADGKASVSVDYLGLQDDSEQTGAIFFAELNSASLGFFPRVTPR